MKYFLFVGILFAAMFLTVTSCVTGKHVVQAPVSFRCVVDAGSETIYDIHLDGKLVTIAKTVPAGKGLMMIELVATPGDHALVVTAPGYETWRQTITVLDGIKYGPLFQVELKKFGK